MAVTVLDETLNVTELLPLRTVTLEGTVAALVLLDERETATLAVAVPDSVTVPVKVLPPTAGFGVTDISLMLGAWTVNVAV